MAHNVVKMWSQTWTSYSIDDIHPSPNLKLDDTIKMEFAKFIFKCSYNMLPNSFNNYFIKLENIQNYNTRQKSRNEYFQTSFPTETGKKALYYLGLNEWKSILQEYRQCYFAKFKKFCKNKLLNNYNWCA